MVPSDAVPESVKKQFPKSANKAIYVANAWRPFDEHEKPGFGAWNEGWAPVHALATVAALAKLRDRGFTWVNLQAGGVARPLRDVQIAELI
jgi:hypothetical protein